VNDETVGRALRALRRRRALRQSDLGEAAGVSQSLVSRAERGHFDTLSIRTLRALFGVLDARCSVTPWWRSGELDRLLDEDHAALSAVGVEMLSAFGWESVDVEVTFAVFGERGSIDILALKPRESRALMVEVKTSIQSTEELNRTVDKKARLLPGIVKDRYGWSPDHVGRLLIVEESSTNRRRVARAHVMEATFNLRGTGVRRWLAGETSGSSGLVFLTVPRRRTVARSRVRRPPVTG
jgi:transcriptional regulator with XRE-family HTH domain